MKRTTGILPRMRITALGVLCACASLVSSGCVTWIPLDIAVEILASSTTVAVGDEFTYTIVVTDERAYGLYSGQFEIRQTFSLPVEIVAVSRSDRRGDCTPQPNNTVICNDLDFPDVPRGDSPQVTIIVLVRAIEPGTLISTAEAFTRGGQYRDIHPENNTATATTRIARNRGPDLSVTQTDSPDPVEVGSELTYTIMVANVGTETAAGVTLTDTLPTGVVDITPVQPGCVAGDNTRTCNLGSIPPGESKTITIIATPTQMGTLLNSVVVTLDGVDPDESNNTASASTEVVSFDADLAVTITDDPDPIALGDNVTYTVNVTNNGPATATNVILTNMLPTNADLVSSTPSQGSCDASRPVETCNFGSLVSGASARLTVVVSPREAGTLTNSASVTASENDPNPDNNSATESTTVNEALVPDLSVTVSDNPDPVAVDQPLTHTITVRNNGLGAAHGFTITATMPPSVTTNTNRDFPCSTDTNGNLVCQSSQAGLPSGGEASYTLVVTPTVVGTITNTVHVTTSQTDANPVDNTFTETTTVSAPAPTADIAVTVSDSPDPVVVNQPLTYTVTFTNYGLATATGIVATVTLPSTVNIRNVLSCIPSGGDMICQLSQPFSLSNGASIVYTLQVTPTAGGTINVTASALANEDDSDKNNNTATETTTVSPPVTTADLEIVSVTDSADPAVVNDQYFYTITVRNNGLGDATGVVLTNTLSERVVSDGGFPCPAGNGPVIECLLGNMASGSTQTIFLRVRSSATGTVTNMVSVSAQETDPDPSNNTRTESTTIIASNSADVSVSIAANPNPVTLPADVTITMVVQNTGPLAANGTVLTGFDVRMFQVPELLNITTTQGTCSLSTFPTLTCNVGTLAANASATVTITGRPLAGTFTRTVTANTSTNDPNLANNTASVTVTAN